jgi:hypothetical protein
LWRKSSWWWWKKAAWGWDNLNVSLCLLISSSQNKIAIHCFPDLS